MSEFIKSIFKTPVNLWTLPQELFVFIAVISIIVVGCLIALVVGVVLDKIKYRGCKVKKVAPSQCNSDCKNCSYAKQKNKLKKR